MRIDRVVTKGGDGGETSLGDGTRVRKDSATIEAIGSVDEANAVLGVLRLHTRTMADIDAELARVQNDLFDVSADLCVPGEAGDRLRLTDAPTTSNTDEGPGSMSRGLRVSARTDATERS